MNVNPTVNTHSCSMLVDTQSCLAAHNGCIQCYRQSCSLTPMTCGTDVAGGFLKNTESMQYTCGIKLFS